MQIIQVSMKWKLMDIIFNNIAFIGQVDGNWPVLLSAELALNGNQNKMEVKI